MAADVVYCAVDGEPCAFPACRCGDCVEEKALNGEFPPDPFDFFLESCDCENCLVHCDPTDSWCDHYAEYLDALRAREG